MKVPLDRGLLAVLGCVLAAAFCTTVDAKTVVILDIKQDGMGQPTEDGYLSNMEGYTRGEIDTTAGDVVVRGGSMTDALAQVAGAMRAGATFLNAVESMVDETSGPISQEFSLMLREQRMGLTLSDALENVAERVQTEEMDLLITATQISRELGGNLSEIFERLSITLRRKMEMEGKIDALTSQGKMQGWVVGLLPFFIILALTLIEPESMKPIYTSLLGWIFLAIILTMELLGAVMIRKIVNIDV